MRMQRTILLTILFCASVVRTQAQNTFLNRYNLLTLNMSTGLPSNQVRDMHTDSFGFVWIASSGAGLLRYDGYQIDAFSSLNLNSAFRSNSCRNITEDSFHRLWTCFDEYTAIIDLKTMKTPDGFDKGLAKEALSQPAIRTYHDSKGKMWLVTNNHIYCFSFYSNGDIKSIAKSAFKIETPDVPLCDIDGNGKIWAGANGKLFRLFLSKDKIRRENMPAGLSSQNVPYATAIIRQKNYVWIASNIGLLKYDKRTHACKWFKHNVANPYSLSHDYVTSLAIAPNGSLLAGSLCGVNILSSDKGFTHWDTTSPINPLESDFVNCLMILNGQIWVGTDIGGLQRIVPRTLHINNYVHNEKNASSISPNAVNAMYAEPNGILWVGTVEGGLNRKMPDNNSFSHFTSSNSTLSHNSVSVLCADKYHKLWIGTWGGGLNYIDLNHPNRITTLKLPAEYASLTAFMGALAYDYINDGLWLCANSGIFYYDFKTKTISDPFPENREIRGCIGSIITKDGKLWVGNIYGAIIIDLKSSHGHIFKKRILRYKLDAPTDGIVEKISCFCQSKNGTLWLGSSEYGLYKRIIKNGKEKFICYDKFKGLANNAVKGIIEDKKGMLWIATVNGLSCLNPKTDAITNYDEHDGLTSSQFHWNAIVKSNNGHIFLASNKGLTEIAGEYPEISCNSKIRFTEIMVNNQLATADSRFLNQDITVCDKINLHEGDRSVTISFSALNYEGETRGVYSYRLKGYDDDWVQLAAGEHSVKFSGLPSGHYTLEVKYNPALGKIKSSVASLNIDVAPYFWHSWWFISIIIIASTAIGVYIYNVRVIKLRQHAVEELYRPIEKAMKESGEPELLQKRIQSIIDSRRHVINSTKKSAEEDEKQVIAHHKFFIDRATQVMEKHYMESDFGITDLCKAMRMGRSLLSQHLHEEVGMSTGQFIRHYRLEIAYKLLETNAISRNVTEVAYSVGFNDPKYFTRCFTKEFGIAPSKFMKG